MRALCRVIILAGSRISSKLRRLAKMSPRTFMYDFEFFAWHNKETGNPKRFPVSVTDVLFVTVGFSKYRNLSRINTLTWLNRTEYYIFADVNDSSIPNFFTLPEIRGKTSLQDSKHRQLRGVVWLMKSKRIDSSKKWIFVCDDDAWVNVPSLLNYLGNFDPSLPIAIGKVFDNNFVRDFAFHNGGAGRAISRTALRLVTEHLYKTKRCPIFLNEDTTFALCFHRLGILKIDSDKFNVEPPVILPSRNDSFFLFRSNYLNAISFHHFSSYEIYLKMTCDAAFFWRFKGPTSCPLISRGEDFVKKYNKTNTFKRPFTLL